MKKIIWELSIILNLFFALKGMQKNTSDQHSPLSITTKDKIIVTFNARVAQESAFLKEKLKELHQSGTPNKIKLENIELETLHNLQTALKKRSKHTQDERANKRLLQEIIADLELNNNKLINFCAAGFHLQTDFGDPALFQLKDKEFEKEECLQLQSIGNHLIRLWQCHPAQEIIKITMNNDDPLITQKIIIILCSFFVNKGKAYNLEESEKDLLKPSFDTFLQEEKDLLETVAPDLISQFKQSLDS